MKQNKDVAGCIIRNEGIITRSKRKFCLLLSSVVSLLLASTVYSATNWPTLKFTLVTNGFVAPVGITSAEDGSGRLFITEQRGRIRILQNGSILSPPFLEITNRVLFTGTGNEQGLLGLAFPPNYKNKGYFYVNYTRVPDGATVISRFFLSTNTNVASTNIEQIILTIPQPYENHNGGQLAFGPDGFLYIPLGDGGYGGDPGNRAQNTTNLLGKILRINVESVLTNGYQIPPSNPFVGSPNHSPEIWALGLRNPWRCSFDRLTGDFYIADVGQGEWEEIDFQPASSSGGENYGWRIMEGNHINSLPSPNFNTNTLTRAVAEYNHTVGRCVIGGYVGRNPSSPHMYGTYFFADYVNHQIWGLRKDGTNWQMMQLAQPSYTISSFGQDEQGRIYIADHVTGQILLMEESSLIIKNLAVIPNGNVRFSWDSLSNRSYQVQYSSNLTLWNNLGSTLAGTGSQLNFTNTNTVSASPIRFYRVRESSP